VGPIWLSNSNDYDFTLMHTLRFSTVSFKNYDHLGGCDVVSLVYFFLVSNKHILVFGHLYTLN
jgi:hypothetical protein